MTRWGTSLIAAGLVAAASALTPPVSATSFPPGPGGLCTDTLTIVQLTSLLNKTGTCAAATPNTTGSPGDTIRGVSGTVIGFDEVATGFDIFVEANGATAGQYAGIDVFTGGSNLRGPYGLNRGDSVVVEFARVANFNGDAELVSPNGSFASPNIVLRKVAAGNPLPPAFHGNTTDFVKTVPNATIEPYSSCLVTLNGPVRAARTAGLAAGGLLVVRDAAPADSVYADFGRLMNTTPPAVGTVFASITGIANATSTSWRILPRDAYDVVAAVPPNVADAYSLSETQVRVVYDRDVTAASATLPSNYSLGSLGSVDAAAMDGTAAVILTVSGGAPHGNPESVTVNNVVDAANGVPMTTPQTRAFVMGVLSAAEVQAPDPDSLAGTPCVDKSRYAGPASAPGIRVTVTGVTSAAFPALEYLADANGDPRGGVALFGPVSPVAAGHACLVAGAIEEFATETEVLGTSYVRDLGASAAPAAAVLGIDVATDATCDATQSSTTAEDYEGMLITLQDVRVTASASAGQSFVVAGPSPGYADSLLISDLGGVFTYAAQAGQSLDVTGVLGHVASSGTWSLLPRSDADIVPHPFTCRVTAISSLPASITGSTVGLPDDFHCGGNTAPDVMYSFVTRPADTSWTYMMSLCGSSYNARLEVRTGGVCPGSFEVACTDSGCRADSAVTVVEEPYLNLSLSPSTQYFVIVDGAQSAADAGTYQLNIWKQQNHPLDQPTFITVCGHP